MNSHEKPWVPVTNLKGNFLLSQDPVLHVFVFCRPALSFSFGIGHGQTWNLLFMFCDFFVRLPCWASAQSFRLSHLN
jgi:hypothetical protein